jgi:hypothetical protein
MNSQLGQSWLEASADLGVRVVAPFVLTTEAGEAYFYDVIIYDFGLVKGMLLMEKWDDTKAKVATEHGYGYSCMDAGPYDRESTLEVLQDWGWSGSAASPSRVSRPTRHSSGTR